MAWRPYENLIAGELDNTTPGQVTGCIKFFRQGKKPLRVTLKLKGDFREDIRGKKIRITNPEPRDRNEDLERSGSYVDGISRIQEGEVGDITAGIPVNGRVPYVEYPYIEWFSKANGRIVLELESNQIEITDDISPFLPPLTEEDKRIRREKRESVFFGFLEDMAKGLSKVGKNSKNGGER